MINIPTVFKAFIIGVAITLLATWLSVAGSFNWINLKWHDFVLQQPLSAPVSNSTLLINNDLAPHSDLSQQLNQLLAQLSAFQPRNVVLIGQPYFHDKVLNDVSLPVYAAIKGDIDNSHISIISGFSFQTVNGVYRRFVDGHQGHMMQLYDLPVLDSSAQHSFNFFADIYSVANLPLSQALQGGLIGSLVKDKVVIISLDNTLQQTRFYTPVGEVTHGQLQALAADTLLSDSAIRQLPLMAVGALLLGIFTLYVFALQLLSPKGTLFFTFTMLLLSIAVAIMSLAFWHILLPMFELLALQLGSVAYLLSVERLREESVVLRISAELNARLSKKVQPPTFNQAQDPWDNLHTLINQHLNLKRSIFLAKIPKDHRVQAIHALNCTLDDIKEMRRDYQRAPYSEAIAVHRPLKLDREYFNQLAENEWEYICPLMVSGEVLGFWALTVIPGKDFNRSVFDNNLVHFSREITELLFHRQNYQRRNKKESSLMRRFLGMKLAESEYRSLNASVTVLERRFDSLQFVFDGLTTASALYNLFGQILHANQQLDKLAQQWQLPVYSLTAHDFLLKLTGLDSQVVKQRLLQVTLHNAQASFKLNVAQQQSYYVLKVRAVNVADNKTQQGFMMQGLLFELIDISEAQKVISMKKDLYSQYFHQMRNNLSTLNLISRRLSKQLPDDKQQFVTMLEQSLEECTKVNVVIEDQLAMQRKQTSTVVPLNPVSFVQSVLNAEKEAMALKRIETDFDAPAIMSLVMAEPDQLSSIVHRIVDILIEDSDSNGSMFNVLVKDVAPEESQRFVVMSFVNQGYGMPQEHIDKLLLIYKDTPIELSPDGEKLERLLLLIHQSSHWEVTVEVESTLGSGYEFRLTVPVFLVQ